MAIAIYPMRIQIIFYQDGENHEPVSSPEIPAQYRHFQVPYAERSWTPGRSAGLITQQIEGDDYVFTVYDFFIAENVTLHPVAIAPLVTYVFNLSGTVNCDLTGYGSVQLREASNYLFYIPGGVRHEVHFTPGHYRILHFTLGPLLLPQLAKDYPVIRNLLDMLEAGATYGTQELEAPFSLRTWALLNDVLNLQPANGHLHTLMHTKIFELLLEYTKLLEHQEKIFPVYPTEVRSLAKRLLLAKELIENNEGKRLSIEQIARKAAMNSKQLKEGFKNMFRITIGQYQLQCRMTKAVQMLLDSSVSIDNIADHIGYDDRSSFTRKFKVLHKMTPLQYRLRFKKQNPLK